MCRRDCVYARSAIRHAVADDSGPDPGIEVTVADRPAAGDYNCCL